MANDDGFLEDVGDVVSSTVLEPVKAAVGCAAMTVKAITDAAPLGVSRAIDILATGRTNK